MNKKYVVRQKRIDRVGSFGMTTTLCDCDSIEEGEKKLNEFMNDMKKDNFKSNKDDWEIVLNN